MTESKITVTVDKSHLVTLGERLYVEAVELFRELISNAYDADATEVFVRLGDDVIVVEDNGSGMNEKGLAQFFNIGSPAKRVESVSPRLGRRRIGQFGIGKFAVLTAADEFSVESCKGSFVYQVTFSRQEWEAKPSWELPVHKEPSTALHHEGTKVTLSRLKKKFTSAEVEKYIREVLPLRAKKFKVCVNDRLITLERTAGRHTGFSYKTLYGEIVGEITIANDPDDIKEPGLECRVKGVLVKKSLFGIDPRRHGVQRLTGWIEADFLPLTSSRTEFVRDSAEYKFFDQLVRAELEKILKTIKHEIDKRELKKMQAMLKEILEKLREALKNNPELTPTTESIARRRKLEKKKIAQALATATMQEQKQDEEEQKEPKKVFEKKEQAEPKELPKATYERRFRLAKLGVTCGFAHLGEEGPEVMSEGSVIYINQDHPLYLKLYPKQDPFTLHLFRLITQEIVLMKKLRLPAREAFSLQSRLLRDALT